MAVIMVDRAVAGIAVMVDRAGHQRARAVHAADMRQVTRRAAGTAAKIAVST
ncbi:MAG: hypothetical protein ACYDAC_05085 [Candidatus Dormibacteria bacterium]